MEEQGFYTHINASGILNLPQIDINISGQLVSKTS